MPESYPTGPRPSTENTTGKAPTTDPGTRPTVDDMARWLAVLHPADHAIEVRAPDTTVPGSNKRITVVQRFAPGVFREAITAAYKLSGKAPAVYLVLNGIDPALPRKGKLGGGAKAGDIPRRYRLLIDCDPTREGGVSATDEEKAEAFKVMEAIRAYLRARGFPEPITADSGNGWHLVYAIDLPNNDDSTVLVKAVLAALAAKFDTAAVKVDQVVFDPPRLVKFYGTVSAKGKSTAERPHRYSRTLTAPAALKTVPTELLRALAAEAPPKPFDMDAEIQRKRDQAETDLAPKTILPIDEHLQRTAKKARANDRGESPSVIDDYNRNAKWPDLLPAGWRPDHCQGDTEYWTRPGKGGGTSASIHRNAADRLYLFTTNAPPFEPGKAYSKFDAYLLLNRLTVKEGVKALAAEGYGTKAKPRAFSDGPTGVDQVGPEPSTNGTEHAHEAEPGTVYEGATDAEMGIVDLSEVKCENPVWLWGRRFLKGKINLIAGAGGDGKTTVAIMVGSVVTRGGLFPDGSPSGAPGRVLILAAEDGAEDTIKPRFIAAGADVSFGKLKVLTARVNIPKKGDRPAMVHPVCLQDLEYWRWVFETHRPTVLIIDPLPAYLGRGVNDHKNSDVQAALQSFAALANEFGVCVIAITHTGKATDRKLIHKVLGSVAYTNVARVVHVTLCDPDNPETRYLHREKCNLDKPVNALSYKLVSAEFDRDGETFQSSRVEFDAEPVAIDAEAMSNPKRGDGGPTRGPDPKKETAAAEWLHDFLDGRPGWTDRRDVIAAAGAAGIIGRLDEVKQRWSNFTMLYRARKRLPTLDDPRSGKRVDEEDMKTERDRYPRICWKLLDAEAAY